MKPEIRAAIDEGNPSGFPDEPEFQVGDVVRLKSGSLNMTISYMTMNGKVTVYWYDTSQIHSNELPVSVLMKVSGNVTPVPKAS
jgi:uncharacterized protein YodC (DUF2158 family)